MTEEKKDAWGYVRLSQESDTSIEEQKESIREYARETGLDLQTTRNDGKNTSGFDDDREEYQLLRGKIESGDIDAVITRDRARMSRDFDERLRLIATMRSVGVEWHVVEAGGSLDLEDVEKAGMECLHAMMDHVKKKVEIERSRKVIEKRLDQGFDQGRPPYGFQFDAQGEYWVPDKTAEDGEKSEFERALDVIDARQNGLSWRKVAEETGVSKNTARRIWDRRNRYLDEMKK